MNQLEYPKQVGIFQPIFVLGRNFKGVRATPERVYPQVMLETCAQRLDLSKSVQVSFGEHGVHAIFCFLWEQMCEMWNSARKSNAAMEHFVIFRCILHWKEKISLHSCFIGWWSHVPRVIISAFFALDLQLSSCNGITRVFVLFGCRDAPNPNSKRFSSVLSGENWTRCGSEAQKKREKPLEIDSGRVFYSQPADPLKVD